MRARFAVVGPAEARADPYPCVYVNEDGSVRELHPDERAYLETQFEGADGARPYVKSSFDARNGWGSLTGFLPRTKLPSGASVASAPAESPVRRLTREGLIEQLRGRDPGVEIIERPDGTMLIRKGRRRDPGLLRRLVEWLGGRRGKPVP